MEIDVVYVTYNSINWIDPCFSSWENEAEKGSAHIYIVDNGSTDETLEILNKTEREIGKSFSEFQIISGRINRGFGVANNIAASYGKSEYIFFLNIDTEMQENTLEQLFSYIEQSPQTVAIWELRQIPYEHPKYYDPVTLETTWSSGAAFVIRRKIYEEICGFDPHFFMYAEDVDLSWRVRAAGYKIIYCPKALIKHNSYSKRDEIKPLQYGYSMRNNLLMRRRYGTLSELIQGWILLLKLLVMNQLGWSFNKKFLKIVFGYFKERKHFTFQKSIKKAAYFHGLDYSKMRYGAFQETGLISHKAVYIWTFILCEDDGAAAKARHCMMNQTFSSKRLDVIRSLAEAVEKMDCTTDPNDWWINIICEGKCVFADHNELLISMVEDGIDVVGTVDEHGQNGQNLSYYLFGFHFYRRNRQSFLKCDQALLTEMCSMCSKIGGKQTVL